MTDDEFDARYVALKALVEYANPLKAVAELLERRRDELEPQLSLLIAGSKLEEYKK